jgi:uncharacterized alpha-E superfamily protein
LPAACEALLGQELRLETARTWWCGDPASLRYVLDHLDDLLIRPIAELSPRTHGGSAPLWDVSPADLTIDDRNSLRRAIESSPASWAAQEKLSLSTTPTLGAGGLQPRRTVLRSYAVATGGSFEVMAGGLTRVAPDDVSPVISNQLGAIAKDTWVLAGEPERPSLLWLQPGAPSPASDIETFGNLPERAVENLFWLGRYAERAEAIVRLLRAIDDRRFDQTLADHTGEQAIGVLLAALAAATYSPPTTTVSDIDAELASVAGDPSRHGSLAFAVSHLLSSAEAVRDRLSVDTWQVTASLERDLLSLASASPVRSDVVQGTLSSVTRALLAFQGLVGESMVREAGWYFLDAGRRIERFLNLALVLRTSLAVERALPVDSLVLESVLATADSLITYRRRYRSRATVETVCELLVVDAANPRSLRYQLDRLDEALAHLPSLAGGANGAEASQLTGSALDLLTGVDTATMASTDERGNRSSLVAALDGASSAIIGAADAIGRSSFGHHPPQQPLGQEDWS